MEEKDIIMSENTEDDKNITEEDKNSLYNRQIYVIGEDTMKKLQQANVLIVGLNGVGVEVSKNIILMGVKSVTLLDEKKVSMKDLSSQVKKKN
jgi:ubiquitin-activating enzyme E1